jgi:hypothetical protein
MDRIGEVGLSSRNTKSISIRRASSLSLFFYRDRVDGKSKAIAAYRTRVTNAISETRSAPLLKGFLWQFLQAEEIFFEVITKCN